MLVIDVIMIVYVVVLVLDNLMLINIKGEKVGILVILLKFILIDILCNQFKFDGLILIDVMDMGVIISNFECNWFIKQVIMVGNDIVLMLMEIKNCVSIE